MVLSAQPIFSSVEAILKKNRTVRSKRQILLLSPRGKKLVQGDFKKLTKFKQLILICGRYEGVDERVSRYLADEEVSIGDYVLTGGELPAMVLIDAVVRLLPGVLGNKDSNIDESFQTSLLEYPQYTRPEVFNGRKVPVVLLSGDHEKIKNWRKKESLKITKKRRPELLKGENTGGKLWIR